MNILKMVWLKVGLDWLFDWIWLFRFVGLFSCLVGFGLLVSLLVIFFPLVECLLGWVVFPKTSPPQIHLDKIKNHIIFPCFFGLFTIFRSSEPFGACWVARAAVCRAAPSARRCWRHSRRQPRQPSLPRQRNAGAKWEGKLP